MNDQLPSGHGYAVVELLKAYVLRARLVRSVDRSCTDLRRVREAESGAAEGDERRGPFSGREYRRNRKGDGRRRIRGEKGRESGVRRALHVQDATSRSLKSPKSFVDVGPVDRLCPRIGKTGSHRDDQEDAEKPRRPPEKSFGRGEARD